MVQSIAETSEQNKRIRQIIAALSAQGRHTPPHVIPNPAEKDPNAVVSVKNYLDEAIGAEARQKTFNRP